MKNTYYHISRKEESCIFFDTNEKFITRNDRLGGTFLDTLNYHFLVDLEQGKGPQAILLCLMIRKQ